MTSQKTHSKTNKGRWTDDEHERFEAAIEMYGVDDMKLLEAHIKTRDVTQIRTHYKHLERTRPDLFSPEKVGKKRASTESSSSPKKKTKTKGQGTTTPKKAAATPAENAPGSAKKGSILSAYKKKSSKSVESEDDSAASEDAYDGKPPPLVETKKRGHQRKLKQPAKASTTVQEPTEGGEGDVVEAQEEISVQDKLVGFMKKEEVQTVIAGVLGFVLVLAVKKYFM
jgi:hypothetical protein